MTRRLAHDLETAEAIAAFLGRGRQWLLEQRKRKHDPVPVRRFCGRLVASSEQLTAWAERNTQGETGQ